MGDNRFYDDDPAWEEPQDDQPEEIPASVTFMEIMRQAAARKSPPPAPSSPATEAVSPSASQEAPRQNQAPPAPSEAAMEEQRIRRVKRRRARRRYQTVGVLGGIFRTFFVVIMAAGLMATIFTWWTPSEFISQDVQNELSIAIATSQVTPVPTGLPTPNWFRRVGIVSGHRGPQVPPDPGAVCPDGLTEAEINFAVAQKVVIALSGRGYAVDLLDEFDPRLDGYQAAALVSIHANTCQDFGELVSGFLIARAAARVSAAGNDDLLVDCVARYYQQSTGLDRREGLTVDMTDYHTFREINQLTPASIIELGFMKDDRDVLVNRQDDMAKGIIDGILCFLEPGDAPPLPTVEAEVTPGA